MPLADSPTRRRGKKSLLIRRDATLRISGALHLGIFNQPGENEFFNMLLIPDTPTPLSKSYCEASEAKARILRSLQERGWKRGKGGS
jgi:hypothetical protein